MMNETTVSRFRRRVAHSWVDWLPGLAVVTYLLVTVILYVTSARGDGAAPNVGTTTLYALGAVAAVIGGYALALWRRPVGLGGPDPVRPAEPGVPPLHLLLIIGASCWWILFGAVSMMNRGIGGPSELISRVLDPRSSYYAKFDEVGAAVNPVLQLLTLTGLLYWVLVPMTVFYWRRLGLWTRLLALVGVGSYALLFLSTGTQKGVADVCIQAVVAFVAIGVARRRFTRWHAAAVACVCLAAIAVMATSLGQRTDATSSIMQQGSNAAQARALERVLGSTDARGLIVLRDYATQGYRGLGYSFDVPFEWSYGVGSMRSISAYLPQYLGVADPYERTYPVRVETRFGWSATESWSTVFPWLASDLTFPGVLVLLVALGWALARMWTTFRSRSDVWSLVGLVVLSIFFVFTPANNQLFNDRYAALGVFSLIAVWLLRVCANHVRRADDARTFLHRVAAFVVRSATRWWSRFVLAVRNRVARRPAVDPEGSAVVSVTTFGARVATVHLALESIARGTVRPGRLMLWVDEEVYEQALARPALRRMVRRGLEIRPAESELGPHKKYFHYTQQESGDLTLVLADDDIVYPPEWLDLLLTAFEEEHGQAVVSWWVKQYELAPDGHHFTPYRTWRAVSDTDLDRNHYLMGGSGTALPAALVARLKECGRDFLACAPRADDVWLNLLALRTGVGVRQVREHPLPIITIPMTQRNKLSRENVIGNLNDEQLARAFTAEDRELLGAEVEHSR